MNYDAIMDVNEVISDVVDAGHATTVMLMFWEMVQGRKQDADAREKQQVLA